MSNCEMKRCLKIVLLLGVVTIFATPDDTDPDPFLAVIEVAAVEQATARFSLSVPDVQAEPPTAKWDVSSITAAPAYSIRSCSIIDITCARIC
jgi:hypothetical protein